MNLDDYVPLALRSEKPLEAVVGNRAFVTLAIETLISAGKLADLLKKSIVYGKVIPRQQWYSAFDAIALDCAQGAGAATVNDQLHTEIPLHPRLLHAALGGIGEEAELLEALVEAAEAGEPLDVVNVAEEAGDCLWYQALKLDAIAQLGIDPPAVLSANIEKLKARFPDKFSLEASEARDTSVEREVLERAL